jgi:ABC-type branched-subunit amino acid transport system substrate-binding protein
LGKDADYIVTWRTELPILWDNSTRDAKEYYELVADQMGIEQFPGDHQARMAFEQVQVMVDAITRAGSLDPVKIRDAVAVTDMWTINGHIKYDSTGKNPVKSLVFAQIMSGSDNYIYPSTTVTGAKVANATIVFPFKPWDQR